jgi:hypothetical protein
MVRPRVDFNDGHSMSIQASYGHYCNPRDDTGPYTCVEVGFPDFVPSTKFLKHAECPEHPTDTVYGWVPVEILEKEIEAHGGLVEGTYWWRSTNG